MGFWAKLFGRREAAYQSTAVAMMTARRPPARGSRQIVEAYNTHPNLRRNVDRIATSIASNEWKLYRKKSMKRPTQIANGVRSKGSLHRRTVVKDLQLRGDLTEIETHPLLDLLNRPNPYLTSRQVMYTMSVHLDTVGETFIVLEEAVGTGLPAEMNVIPPSWVNELPVPGDPQRLTYVWQAPGGPQVQTPYQRMLWIKNPNPADPMGRGSGIGLTLNNELDADEQAAMTVAAKFTNNAIPDAIISLPGMEETQIAAFQDAWDKRHRGVLSVSRPHVTTDPDMKVEVLSSSFVDLDLVNLRKSMADNVRETYGIPPELIGDVENSNRATIQAAQGIFATYVLVPRLDNIEDCLNSWLVPLFGDDIVLMYESPVPADWDFMLEVLRSVPYAAAINELRALAGLSPVENGDLHPVLPGVSFQQVQESYPPIGTTPTSSTDTGNPR